MASLRQTAVPVGGGPDSERRVITVSGTDFVLDKRYDSVR